MSAADYSIATEFLDFEGKRLFSIMLQPEAGPARGSVLFLHPFAEEMHKSRRTVAQQSRALAAAGYNVMLVDMSGCGDSSGDIADTSWETWKADTRHAIDVLARRTGLPVTLWGLRLGALLACDLAREITGIQQLLMWQPALNGEQHIDQFLRFELAGQALKGKAGFDRAGLWNQLRAGKSLEVAGYELPSKLALEVSHVRLGDLRPACPVLWMDVAQTPATEPNVANARVIAHWREQGVTTRWLPVAGEAFWRNVDAPDSPLLIAATLEALAES